MRCMSLRSSALPAALLGATILLPACDRAARVEVEPSVVRFHSLDQTRTLRARVFTSDGKALPREVCAWSIAEPRVASVKSVPGGAVVQSTGPGSTTITCQVGPVRAEIPVTVRLAARVDVDPPSLDLAVRDEAAAAPLRITVIDTEGKPIQDRPASSRCDDEAVCRGDDRGQVWPVGPGSTSATVTVDGATAVIPVKVRDARTAEGRPRPVKGNPMLDVERAFAPPPPGRPTAPRR